MSDDEESPRIEDLSWGTIRIGMDDGEGTRTYKDAKLYPGGSRAWDWNETGTSHRPGVQPADVEELVERGARIVVLSRGMNRRLRVPDATLEWLADRGVETRVEETKEAARIYNEIRSAGRPVGGLFHTTC